MLSNVNLPFSNAIYTELYVSPALWMFMRLQRCMKLRRKEGGVLPQVNDARDPHVVGGQQLHGDNVAREHQLVKLCNSAILSPGMLTVTAESVMEMFAPTHVIFWPIIPL